MSATGTSIDWQAYGIAVLIWAPLFVAAVIALPKRKMVPWKFRAWVSFLAALGVAPSFFAHHDTGTIFPAVGALTALEHLDAAGLWFAGVFGALPISVIAVLVFVIWSGCVPRVRV